MKTSISKICLAAAVLLTMSACSSTPKPNTELALSDSALQSAELSGARNYAPIELRVAREKREMADEAMKREEYGRAKRLSDQAIVDAELAQAKTNAERSRIALKEINDGIQLMRAEINRAKAK